MIVKPYFNHFLFIFLVLIMADQNYAHAGDWKITRVPHSSDPTLGRIPNQNEILYSHSDLMTWDTWSQDNRSGLMTPPPQTDTRWQEDYPVEEDNQAEDLEYFFGRGIFVIDRSFGSSIGERLMSMEYQREIEPDNEHTLVEAGNRRLHFTSKVDICGRVANLIRVAKFGRVLDQHNEPYMRVESQEFFLDATSNPSISSQFKPLNPRNEDLAYITAQYMKFNQISDYGTVETLFIPLDHNQTLVVINYLVTVERDVLEKFEGLNLMGKDLSVRAFFLGQSPMNTGSGQGNEEEAKEEKQDSICAGLPKAAEGTIRRMAEALERF